MVTHYDNPVRPDTSSAQQLALAMLAIHRAPRLAAVVTAANAAAAQMGCALTLGVLLRDPGAALWHVAGLFDANAFPLAVDSLGIPTGPFPWAPPDVSSSRPLAAVFGTSWGLQACLALNQTLGATVVVCRLIGDSTEPDGAFLALLVRSEQAAAAGTVLDHAAIATARVLSPQTPGAASGILDPDTLATRATLELGRARRYQRPMAVVVVELADENAAMALQAQLVQGLRQWDILGRLGRSSASLCVVLPETGRAGALGLLKRFDIAGPKAQVGAACFPEDGETFAQLLSIARGRTAAPAMTAGTAGVTGEPLVWVQGAPAGAGPETTRCPLCLTAYSCSAAVASAGAVTERIRALVREALQKACPAHPLQILVDPGPAPLPDLPQKRLMGLFGRQRSGATPAARGV